MVSPLTPIGFDLPQQSMNLTPTSPTKLAESSTAGLQILAESGKGFQQALEARGQAAAVQAKSVDQIGQMAAVSAKAVSESAAMASQISARNAQAFAQSTGNLAETIARLSEAESRRRSEQAKAQYAANKAAATRELENSRIDWIEKGRIDKEGTVAYRSHISDTLAKYSLAPDDIDGLTVTYYGPALDYAKKAESNRQEDATKVTEIQRQIRVEGLKGKLSMALGGLAASVGADQSVVDAHYEGINKAVGDFMGDESIPILDRLSGALVAYQQTNETMSKRNADTSQIQADIIAFQKTADYAASLQGQVLSGETSINDYNNLVRLEAMKNGAKGFTAPDPSAPLSFMAGIQQTQENIRKLQEAGEARNLDAVEASDTVIGALATQFALNPAALAAVESTDPSKLDKNAKAAIKLVKEFNQWRFNDLPNYQQKRAAIQSDMLQIERNFNTWYISAANRGGGGGDNPSMAKQLEQLRIAGVTVDLVQGGGQLTPEQTAAVQKVTNELLQSKREEAAALDQEFVNNKTRFGVVGLDPDVATMKGNYTKQQDALKKYNERLQQIQSQKLSSPYEQPGQSPNFNGGAPGKPGSWSPLARGRYGGQTITLPFPQGTPIPALEGGQSFGAPRPGGRAHGGLDFAVPVGTPTVSLVYGTITEVKSDRGGDTQGYGNTVEVTGDDGKIYYYAHLSQTKVKMGQRVGPGQVVALTGQSGIGSGPHLHLEVAVGEKHKTIDPIGHLASNAFGDRLKQPRTANKGGVKTQLDKRAIPIGMNSYLLDGKVIQVTPQLMQQNHHTYNSSAPLRSSYNSNYASAGMYATDRQSNEGNMGFSILAQDVQLQREIHRVAKNLKIPSEWLADVISYESNGTFSASIGNGMGYYGLIQFGAEAAQDLGVSQEQLRRMTPAAQMKYVEKYLRLQMRYAGVDQLKGPEMLVAAINQGHTVLRDVAKRGKAAILDPSNRDGAGVTLKYYLDNLGKFSGRQYRYQGGTRDRILSSAIHERPRGGCTMCSALASQSEFVTHEGVA